MNILEKIDDIIEKENFILPKKEIVEEIILDDEQVFSKLADFIINIDIDKLNIEQKENISSIINNISFYGIDEGTPALATRSSINKNSYSKKWYSKNKTEVKRKKEALKRSGEGKRREFNRDRMESKGKTLTGRNKTRYHIRQKSDRRDREKNLNRT